MKLEKRNISLYFWLIPGVLFFVLGNGRFAIPVASWLFAVFLLKFSRGQTPLKGFLMLAPIIGTASILSFWGTVSPQPGFAMNLLPGVLGLALTMTYFIDRVLSVKIEGFASTLVFPLAYTVFDFILARFNPMGSTGVLAYSQYYNLPLIQIVSITGLWGLTFLITWFGAIINWIWENKFNWQTVKRGSLIYLVIIMLVLLYGGARLSFADPVPGTVQVAGIYVYDLRLEGSDIWSMAAHDRAAYRNRSQEIQDLLFQETEKQVHAGAKVVVWSEISPFIAGEDYDQFIIRSKQFASNQNIYLAVSPYIDYKNKDRLDENILHVFSPQGEEVLRHLKFGGSIFEGTLAGDAKLNFVNTEYGNISGVICWDQDFPHIMRQAGKNKTDIMIAPNADWLEITPMHTHIGIFRAIENGYSLIRPNVNGLSVITDPYGRVLAANDHFVSNDWTITAHVPIQGVRTVYSFIGDIFAWLAIASLGIMVSYTVLKKQAK